MNSAPQVTPKKRYQVPHLTVYGTVEKLTANVASVSIHADGGTGQTNKTH
jgi:hypothetical protein